MRILRVDIGNFRGIKSAKIEFPPHALLVGPNNACKSTVLEALDMVLGPDRARGPDAIDEHDFFRGNYRALQPEVTETDEGGRDDDIDEELEQKERSSQTDDEDFEEIEQTTSASPDANGEAGDELEESSNADENERPEIKINIILGDLDEAQYQRFRSHLEPWNEDESRLYTPAELGEETPEEPGFVLRVGFRGWYEEDEDEFRTKTFFLNPDPPDGERDRFGRSSKQSIGFLYLRSLRTGRRAASLERGSLLDILLREKMSRPQLWETILEGLDETGEALDSNEQLRDALNQIQSNIEGIIPLADDNEPASTLRPGRLTRRHLRQTITYFLASRDSAYPLPFDRLGSGTSNVLVFALLSAIAEAKDNVIFAMEEPEIALPPHTQRVIVQRLKKLSAQAILSSHSPYVGELFLPDALVVLKRDDRGDLLPATPRVGEEVKEKTLRREFRTRFAEGLLARGVVIVEGLTEFWGLPAAVEVLANIENTEFTRFDRDGLVFIPADGSGDLEKLADYFASLGIRPLVVCDELETHEREPLETIADPLIEHPYKGFEKVISEEMDIDVIHRIIQEWERWPNYPTHIDVPSDDALNSEWRTYFFKVLKSRKGEGYAERVLLRCQPQELPETIIDILQRVRTAIGRQDLPDSDPLASIFETTAPSEEGSAESSATAS